jgi:hypothetical protein
MYDQNNPLKINTSDTENKINPNVKLFVTAIVWSPINVPSATTSLNHKVIVAVNTNTSK